MTEPAPTAPAVADAELPDPGQHDSSGLLAALCRPWVALVVTVVVLGLATLLLDSSGFLGTDTGGKVATFEAMADRPLGLDPDIGYWAAEWDPQGELHGLVYTDVRGDEYVNATTLPMIELGAPLYRVGGYRLVLLLPILGCAAAAFAARALARRMGADERRSSLAYWVTALASPLAVYALDAWEHTIGVALVAWGVVALLDAVDDSGVPWRGLLAGLAFGAAFSMRTEALVYGFVATALALGWVLLRRRIVRALSIGVAVVVGLAAMLLANLALERAAIGSSFRAGRASGTASSAGAGAALRAKEALLTTFGLESGISWDSLLPALLTSALLIALLVLVLKRADRRVVVCVGGALAVMVLARVADGPGFVPGLLPAAPLAAFGLVVSWWLRDRPAVRYLTGVALASLPLVWAFQYTGGAGPQWGGRYVLVSGLLLATIGVVGLDRIPFRAAVAVVGAALVVTVLGVAWLSVHSHEVADAARYIAERPEAVVISTEPFWLRELAAEYQGSRWLSVGTRPQLDAAAAVVEDAGFDSFALLEVDPRPEALEVPGFEPVAAEERSWLDERFRITTYQRAP